MARCCEARTRKRSFRKFCGFLGGGFARLYGRGRIGPSFFGVSSFLRIYDRFVPNKTCTGLYRDMKITDRLDRGHFVRFRLAGIGDSPFMSSIMVDLLFSMVGGGVLSSPSGGKCVVFSRCTRATRVGSLGPLSVGVRRTITAFCRGVQGRGNTMVAVVRSPMRLPSGRFAGKVVDGARLLCILRNASIMCSTIMSAFGVGGRSRMGRVGSVRGGCDYDHPCSRY